MLNDQNIIMYSITNCATQWSAEISRVCSVTSKYYNKQQWRVWTRSDLDRVQSKYFFKRSHNFFKCSHIIAAHQGGFIVPYVWEIVVRKNLTNLEGCHFARFYILISRSFPKIEAKDFNSASCFFKLVKFRDITCCTLP